MWTDFCAVTYRNKVAQLTTLAYHGVTKCASFDPTASTDFNVIFYNYNTSLWYFVVYALMGGIAEPVFAYCRIRIYNYTITYFATIVNSSIGIDYAIVTNLHTLPNVYAGIDYAAVADLCLIGYCYRIMNVAVGTNFRTVRN
ncbi:hypothetical protein ES703_103508 [subsurface metagenome]